MYSHHRRPIESRVVNGAPWLASLRALRAFLGVMVAGLLPAGVFDTPKRGTAGLRREISA